MDKPKSLAGYPRLSESVILAQTDTTVGFLSQDGAKLASIKQREPTKPFLKNFFSLHELKKNIRIPQKRKKEVRRAKKTTFVVKNQAFRVASFPVSSAVFRSLQWCYSTSANRSSERYDAKYANEKADIIIKNALGLYEGKPSKILKINDVKKVRLR